MARWFRAGLILCVLTIGLVACRKMTEEEAPSIGLGESATGEETPVETLKLVPQTYEETFYASGGIEPCEDMTVSSEVAGRIVFLEKYLGDRVGKGDILVRIDDSAIRAEIKKVRAQIERARTMLDVAKKDQARQVSLFEQNAGSEQALDKATERVQTLENDVSVTEATLEAAQVTLDKAEIRSPIDGVISRKIASYGEYVNPGSQLYDLVATHNVKFVFSLSERDVPRIEVGQKLVFTVDAMGKKEFTAPIKAIAPAGSRRTRTFRVELAMANPGGNTLRPGMSGKVKVIRARYENVYLIPEDAILRDAGRSYVYLSNSGHHARGADVEILSSVGATAVVSANLGSEYDCIILGQYAVSEGSSIRVRRVHEEPPVLQFD